MGYMHLCRPPPGFDTCGVGNSTPDAGSPADCRTRPAGYQLSRGRCPDQRYRDSS